MLFVFAAAVNSLPARRKAVCKSLTQYRIMSSIITAVFKATIGLLVNKGRDKAAEKLKDGDVTDQKFRGLIVREIDDIKWKLDGLARKDLLASISFFEEGIELLYVVFDKARSRNENGKETLQAACAEAFSLVKGMRNLELTGLDESATRALSNAKKRFKDARREATRAFKNEALGTSDRILAMQYRVMATILETIDNPVDALAPCKVCIKELNSLSPVQNGFNIQLKKGIQAVKGLFGKDERRKIISSVCHVNRAIYDVTQAVGEDEPFWMWPAVDTGEGKVDPLRDGRINEVLCSQGMEHCYVSPWSLGREGEEEQTLKEPVAIATNSKGQVIVADLKDSNVKVFDSKGTFLDFFTIPSDGLTILSKVLHIFDVVSDVNDNFYVLVELFNPWAVRPKYVVNKFNYTAGLHHKFSLRERKYFSGPVMAVSSSGKVFVVERSLEGNEIDVYKNDGQLIRSFRVLFTVSPSDITAANDDRVIVVDTFENYVHIFSEHGNHLNKFKLEECNSYPRIVFHQTSDLFVVADVESEKNRLHMQVYTKDGEFLQSTHIQVEGVYCNLSLRGMAVTIEGHIATVLRVSYNKCKVLVV